MANNIPPHIPVAPVLIGNILLLAEALAAHRGCKLATISRAAHKDPRGFDNLKTGESSLSVRKYDECMVWFVGNWPDDLAWPAAPDGETKSAPVRAAAAGRRAIRKTRTTKK